ncbi:hypothetical protein B0T17DRAFT_107698 [Bombardia bombarda]|uniref:Uncharacterized protein n=1 Tax=Bombardia bombarda TaxID=252184 RepID=A0AA40CG95_9PEZI|nr:hypothetical protein B0T17DRAFT_107698 [Bombardia bombarda]
MGLHHHQGRRRREAVKQWLFPECFSCILGAQANDGCWGRNLTSGILNTAASLLAIKRHLSQPLNIPHDVSNLQSRIDKATTSLRSQLAAWDVQATTHVGFEMIVPALLRFLQQEDDTFVFDFDRKSDLETLNAFKLSHF